LISKKKKINPMKYMDVLACVMPLSQAIGRWGNYFNQEAFGSPTTGFMKLFVDEQFRPLIYKNISYFLAPDML
jgi:phosphatidylglycerol:prolipoprotein diacylglycerol transferase